MNINLFLSVSQTELKSQKHLHTISFLTSMVIRDNATFLIKIKASKYLQTHYLLTMHNYYIDYV